MSRNREARIIEAVSCPFCSAAVGQWCQLNERAVARDSGRPIVHPERKSLWQRQRGPVEDAMAKVFCPCGHSARRHGSERADEYGCEMCHCNLTREQARNQPT